MTDTAGVAAPAPAPGGHVPGAGPAAPFHSGVDADIDVAPAIAHAERTASRPRVRLRSGGWFSLVLATLLICIWLITNQTPLITFALALVGAVILDGIVARSGVRFTEVEIRPVGAAIAGDPTRWQVYIERLRRPVAVHPVRLPTPPDVLIERSDPGIVTMPPTSRGVVHFVVFDFRSVGPIGLTVAARRIRATPPTPAIVGPRYIPLHVRWPLPRAVAYGLSEVAPRGDDLFRGVRPYQRGDERRKIHWKATARTGEVMVREDDGTGIVALQIAVDLGYSLPVNDHIVANAAWLAEAAVRRGWLVQLVTVDDTPGVPVMTNLGSPFGKRPQILPAQPGPPQVLAQTVSSPEQIRRQLATAAPGTPPAPRWTGLSCRVDVNGVVWP